MWDVVGIAAPFAAAFLLAYLANRKEVFSGSGERFLAIAFLFGALLFCIIGLNATNNVVRAYDAANATIVFEYSCAGNSSLIQCSNATIPINASALLVQADNAESLGIWMLIIALMVIALVFLAWAMDFKRYRTASRRGDPDAQ